MKFFLSLDYARFPWYNPGEGAGLWFWPRPRQAVTWRGVLLLPLPPPCGMIWEGKGVTAVFDFDDDFFFKLKQEDIASLFLQAKPLAETLRRGAACEGLDEEDARLMSASFAVAVVLLRVYSESRDKSNPQTH